jgi:hypothetical protein
MASRRTSRPVTSLRLGSSFDPLGAELAHRSTPRLPHKVGP